MMKQLFALVDCNNFYPSCERVFNPILATRPVVVLSNNDGCVIARSNEAKVLGIPMGEPLFKVRKLVVQNNVEVFSSNFTLYGDMSRRVMEVLSQHCADLEIYSIDEAFLELRFANQTEQSLMSWATMLRERVLQWTGIPVSIGIARTKTLAKLSNHVAKKYTDTGVCILQSDDPILGKLTIDKVWGVGRRYKERLKVIEVATVADLQRVNEQWMRKEFGVVGVRMIKELKGQICHRLEDAITSRKHTMVSRSFANDIYELKEIQGRLALYATRLGEKLRQYQQSASVLTVYLWVNKYRNTRKDGRSCFAQSVTLPLATNNTNHLIAWSKLIATALFEQGTNYKKAGIMAAELVPQSLQQGNLFQDQDRHQRDCKVMEAIDTINKKMGRSTVFFAACGQKPSIPLRQDFKSPSFTTKWDELITI